MTSKGLSMAVALLLAATATMAVFLYVRGLEKEAGGDGSLVPVVVSDRDIPAGTELNELIDEGAFTTIDVPEDNVIEGAVMDLARLKDQETSAPILAQEQITTARIRGDGQLPGGTLGIPQGHQAVSLPLDLTRATGTEIAQGDHVTIYATFDRQTTGRDLTVDLVPDVEVLDVSGYDGSSGVSRASSTEGFVVLALRPKDAQHVVFSIEHGTVWLGLLPPGQNGARSGPVGILEVAKR